ncbi:roadblock/LC7 domain-containing protein [Streptomyces sp. NPDC058417]|uniref:roadblock/LC7 domain-containing protein n=1 Tax=unclassified Streptomyces TaxID=2593676 RepID=UPI003658D2A2
MNPTTDINWILNELVDFPETRHAIVLSSDGMMVGFSADVDRDLADTVSAIASGMQSLSKRGAAFVQSEPTPWEQTMVSFTGGFLFLLTAAEGAYLIVSASRNVDIEALSYRMGKTIDSLGSALRVAPRHLGSPA